MYVSLRESEPTRVLVHFATSSFVKTFWPRMLSIICVHKKNIFLMKLHHESTNCASATECFLAIAL